MVCKPTWKILPEELPLQNPLLPSLQTSLSDFPLRPYPRLSL